MKNRRPKCITTTTTYEVAAKDIRKGDCIWIGKRVFTVKANAKNDFGQRVLSLAWGSKKEKDDALVVVPKSLVFTVRESKHVRDQSAR
jgi:hypothetical protein